MRMARPIEGFRKLLGPQIRKLFVGRVFADGTAFLDALHGRRHHRWLQHGQEDFE